MFTYHINKQLLCLRCHKYIQHGEMVHMEPDYLFYHDDLEVCREYYAVRYVPRA